MSRWSATKGRRVFAALLRIGWRVTRQARGSHRTLERPDWPDFVFAFRDNDEIGPRMLARIAKHTGLQPSDL
jgi:predicted RNA binding protein YcfA (HicA-like mRNA interferase family)